MEKYKMDLQLFATTMTTDTGTLSAEMKTYYDNWLIDNAEPNLVHDQLGQKRPIPKNGGKKIEFRRYKALAKAMTAITEGVTPAGNSLTVTTKEATVKQYGDFIQMSDVLLLTAIDNNLVEAVKLLGHQAGRTLDTVTREVINAGTNVLYAPKSDGTPVTQRTNLDATCMVTVPLIMKAAATLKGQNATPIRDNCYGSIIHPFVAYDLMQDEKWEEWNKYTNPEHMYNGEIGRIGGVIFLESTEAKIWEDAASTSLSVFSTLVVGENAYGVTEVTGGGLQTIVKQLGSGGSSDPLDQRATAGWKALKTACILADEYMVRIESTSSFAEAAAN